MTTLHRRDFLRSAAAAALPPQAPAPSTRPNVVYILADDLGWGDLGCYNPASRIPTPNADRLAGQGVRFTDMHSPSAVCTPTRYGILTGRYCWRTSLKSGVLWGYSPNLIERGRLTVASMLRSQGYATGALGKWHLGLGDQPKADYDQPLRPCPRDHGFDYFFGIPASLDMDPYVWVENDRAVERPTAKTEGRNDPRGVFWRGGPIAPSFKLEEVLPTLTGKAVDFIRERAARPQPFFLYLALTAPHTPWLPTAPFRGRSGAGDYGDFAVHVDDTLGQVLRALDDSKAAQNTLVVFTSDNGAHWTPQDKDRFPHRANASWRGMKADIQEAGHRIPFLARWPGRIPAGSVSDELGCLTDLLATLADLLHVKLPRNAAEDSYSLLPALEGKRGKPLREAIVHHSSEGLFAIRQGDWKLIEGRGSGGFTNPKRIEPKPGEPPGELYNLRTDPQESKNVYPDHPEVVARLSSLLDLYRKQGFSRRM
jgi:arylsulfatase A-like enzyme